MSPVAAFFDVDETLTTTKSMFRFLEFYWRALGRPEQEFSATLTRFRKAAVAGLPREEANRAFYALFAGHRADEVMRQGEAWFAAELASPGLWNRPGLAAFRRHAAAGHRTVLVSGSFPPCLTPLARHLGADEVLCSEPEIEDGVYTGRVELPMIGAAKGDAAGRLMAAHGLDPAECHAYGDHLSDLPLLERVGHPVVVGDEPRLCAHARQNGWPVLPGRRPLTAVNARAGVGG